MRFTPWLAVAFLLLVSCNQGGQQVDAVDTATVVYRDSSSVWPDFKSLKGDSLHLEDMLKMESQYIEQWSSQQFQVLTHTFTPTEVYVELLRRAGKISPDTMLPPGQWQEFSEKQLKGIVRKNSDLQSYTNSFMVKLARALDQLNGTRTIYNVDNRVETVYDETRIPDPLPARMDMYNGRCVAAVIPKSKLNPLNTTNGTYLLKQFETMENRFRVCRTDSFAYQASPVKCTAFFLKDNLLVTAGHGVNAGNFADFYFVFDFKMKNGGLDLVIPKSKVYSAVRVITRYRPGNLQSDPCIVVLDRPVDSARKPLLSNQPTMAGACYVIGFPLGVPMKLADQANNRVFRNDWSFTIDSDTYECNSGSPVFNAITNQVEGYLAQGSRDVVITDDRCWVSIRNPSFAAPKEIVIKNSQFLQLLNP